MSTSAVNSERRSNMMRELLDVLHEVQGELRNQGIETPSIVVCGNQSSGKSSVLEALTGVKFPSGDGTVTRCPIEVRAKEVKGSPWRGRAADNPWVYNPEDLCNQIARSQPSREMGISRTPLKVEVEYPDGPELQLVDLPGIIQLRDHEQHQKTKDLVESYIRNPLAVILVVSPAADDMANSVVKQLARDADPTGTRTLGVLTKIDHIREDRNRKETVVDMLRNGGSDESCKLRLGYIGVRNRKGEEAHLTIEEIAQREEELFASDSILSTLSRDHFGVSTLKSRVAEVLHQFVLRHRTRLMTDIKKGIDETEQSLKQFRHIPTHGEKQVLLRTLMREIERVFYKFAKERRCGDFGGQFDMCSWGFAQQIKLDIAPSSTHFISDQSLVSQIEESLRSIGSCADMEYLSCFEHRVGTLIVEPLESRSKELIDSIKNLVSENLEKVISMAEVPGVERYASLSDAMLQRWQGKLESHRSLALQEVVEILRAEKKYARFSIEEIRSEETKKECPTRRFVSFVSGLSLDKREMLLNAVTAAVGNEGQYAMAELLAGISIRNEVAASPAASRVCSKLQARAEELITQYGNSIPRLLWKEQVDAIFSECDKLGEELSNDEEFIAEFMQEDPNLERQREKLSDRLRILRNAHDRLANVR